jgi:hypothetical protein
VETIYVLVASGKYTSTINGTSITADNVELVAAFPDADRAYKALDGSFDVKDPDKWTGRTISAYPVQVDRLVESQPEKFYVKKNLVVRARLLTESEDVITAHGPVRAEAGDYVLTDHLTGDTWPIKPDKFAANYEAARM